MVYMSQPLEQDLHLLGIPMVQVSFVPSSDTWQLYGLLYDVDGFGIGIIATDMYYTNYGAGLPNNKTVTLNTYFHMLNCVVPKGNRLGVGFVLYNANYAQASTDFNMLFVYDQTSSITLQTLY